jgi:dTDP-4-dehydrorhamnose reductase
MKLLIIRDQHEFAAHLCKLLEQRPEIITPVPVAWDVIGETVSLDKLIDQQRPDYLVCAVRLSPDTCKSSCKRFRRVVERLERCSRKHGLPLIFISTGAVFDGIKKPVNEDEPYCSVSEYGKFYAELESLIARKLRKHIILRTTWLFSAVGDNFLSAVVDYAAANELISFNSAAKGCPTAEQDLARVVIAILLQIDLGAENWGIYHYSSSDTALGFQFMEAIVAQASQYEESINPKQLNFEHNDQPASALYFEPVVLRCQKLLEAFGIHQRPWRALLTSTVKSHFELIWQQEEGAGHV